MCVAAAVRCRASGRGSPLPADHERAGELEGCSSCHQLLHAPWTAPPAASVASKIPVQKETTIPNLKQFTGTATAKKHRSLPLPPRAAAEPPIPNPLAMTYPRFPPAEKGEAALGLRADPPRAPAPTTGENGELQRRPPEQCSLNRKGPLLAASRNANSVWFLPRGSKLGGARCQGMLCLRTPNYSLCRAQLVIIQIQITDPVDPIPMKSCPKFPESLFHTVIHRTYLLYLNFSLNLFTNLSDLDLYFDQLGSTEAITDEIV